MKQSPTLIAINTRWWNAEAHYALNLGLALRQGGREVVFLANPGSPVERKAQEAGFVCLEGIELDRASPWVQFRNLSCLKAELKRCGIARVVSFKSSGAWIFAKAKQALGIQHIKLRGEARAPKPNRGNRWLFGPQGADGVICSGELVRQWVAQLDSGQEHLGVLHYGAPEPVDNGLGNDLHLPPDKRYLCLLGRTQAVKGHLVALEAMALLNRPDLHLVFLVKDLEEFPEELERIRGVIRDLDLEQKVTLAGAMPNLSRALDAMHVGLVPSLGSELNCRVTVEFFAKSLPVVAFPVGTLPELVNRQNGHLCAEMSVPALAEGIERVLEDRDRLAAQARQDYLDHYTLERLGQGFAEYMQVWGLE